MLFLRKAINVFNWKNNGWPGFFSMNLTSQMFALRNFSDFNSWNTLSYLFGKIFVQYFYNPAGATCIGWVMAMRAAEFSSGGYKI